MLDGGPRGRTPLDLSAGAHSACWPNDAHLYTEQQSGTHTQHYTLTHEVIVPGALGRDHEEPQEPVGEQHLDLFIVRGEVAVRVVPRVLIVATPFIAQRSQLVGRERAGTWGEAKREREH